MTEHQRDVEQLLRSLTRFVRVLQEQHVASTQVNEKLRKKTLYLLRQLNHVRASTFAGLAASRRTIDAMQARLAEEKQQPPTLLATPSSATKVTSEVNKRSEAPDENNGAWVSSTKFMAVVRERNRIQQQLSSILSTVSNMQHRDVVAGAEALEQSLRLTRTRHTEQHEALEEFKAKLRAKDRLVEQSRRENLSLQHRCKDNAAEILTLKSALLFAQTKNDELSETITTCKKANSQLERKMMEDHDEENDSVIGLRFVSAFRALEAVRKACFGKVLQPGWEDALKKLKEEITDLKDDQDCKMSEYIWQHYGIVKNT